MNETEEKIIIDETIQLREKVETLSQQKSSLEQTNIGHIREINRLTSEVDSQKVSLVQLSDYLMDARTNRDLAEAELKTMMDRLHKFMDKYI